MTTYAVNSNGATTRYANYGFDSFCRGTDGKYYGIKADGLYLLEGAVDAEVDFGDLDFGTSALKGMTNAYISGQSDNKMRITVTEGSKSYTYVARDYDDANKTQRVDFGKGLRSNYFGIKLHNNADGSDFTIDAVEIAAVPKTRRI